MQGKGKVSQALSRCEGVGLVGGIEGVGMGGGWTCEGDYFFFDFAGGVAAVFLEQLAGGPRHDGSVFEPWCAAVCSVAIKPGGGNGGEGFGGHV